MSWGNYDNWKLSYPDHWDEEWVLDGELEGYEMEVDHEGYTFLALLHITIERDTVTEVQIANLIATSEEDEHEFKEEDFKYYQGLFDNSDIHQRILDENEDNDKLLTRIA